MNNPTLYMVGGIFLILFFCVMTYFFAKTFRAFHVVMLFLVFGMAMWFLAMASLEHKTRLHWRKTVDRLEKELEQVEREKSSYVSNYTPDENGNWPDTVLTARSKLNRIMLDRGRVWRNCSVTGVNNGAVQLSTVPAGTDAATARPNRIDENSFVYLFAEEAHPLGFKVPKVYLGEFQTSQVTPTTLTVEPTDLRLMLPSQLNLINASQANGVTWAIYEIMPIDSHLIYAVDPNADIKLTGVENQPIFGPMDAAVIQALYNPDEIVADYRVNFPGMNPQQEQAIRAELAKLVDSILRDGGRPKTGMGGGDIDPEENIYEKVQFNTDYTVVVDGASGQGALTSNYFDSQGRAVVDRLRRSGLPFLDDEKEADGTRNVGFEKGDFAIFHFDKARELRTDNTVTPIEPRFVRKLIDFNFEFHNILDRRIKITQDYAVLQRELNSAKAAETDAVKQRDYRKQERDKLLVDKSKFEGERDQVVAYLDQLQQKQAQLRAELSALYRSNAAMAANLASKSKKLTDEINARTEAAVSSDSSE